MADINIQLQSNANDDLFPKTKSEVVTVDAQGKTLQSKLTDVDNSVAQATQTANTAKTTADNVNKIVRDAFKDNDDVSETHADLKGHLDKVWTRIKTALTNATNALNVANNADGKADNAIQTANAVDVKATNAETLATQADVKADNAVANAQTAQTTANANKKSIDDAKGQSATLKAKIDSIDGSIMAIQGTANTANQNATQATQKANANEIEINNIKNSMIKYKTI